MHRHRQRAGERSQPDGGDEQQRPDQVGHRAAQRDHAAGGGVERPAPAWCCGPTAPPAAPPAARAAVVPKKAMSTVSSAGHSSSGSLEKSGGMARRRMSAMPCAPVIRSCGRACTTSGGLGEHDDEDEQAEEAQRAAAPAPGRQQAAARGAVAQDAVLHRGAHAATPSYSACIRSSRDGGRRGQSNITRPWRMPRMRSA